MGETPAGSPIHEYFETMLSLLAELCVSRNYKSIRIVRQLAPRDTLFRCLSSPRLSQRVRALFTRLLMVVYVDVQPQIVVPVGLRSVLWRQLGRDPRETVAAHRVCMTDYSRAAVEPD